MHGLYAWECRMFLYPSSLRARSLAVWSAIESDCGLFFMDSEDTHHTALLLGVDFVPALNVGSCYCVIPCRLKWCVSFAGDVPC